MSIQGPSGALWGEMSLPVSPQPSCPHAADSHGPGLPAEFLLTLKAFGRADLVPVSSFSVVLESSETRHVPHLSSGVQAEGVGWLILGLVPAPHLVEALSPVKLLQAATLKHPCEADPVWSTAKGSQDTSSTSEVKVKCRYPEERPRGALDSPARSHAAVADPRPPVEPHLLGRGIQVKFGSSWSEKYGAPGGTPQEFVLQPGEYITEVDGSYRLFLRHLVIYTSYGRKATFGEKSGRSFSAFPDGSEKVLTGVFGQHKLLGISSIGFEWDYPIVQLTYDQESTTLPQKELGNESDK
ncbi:hypothetical protein MG293_018020 [Ovis ammon polii]|uniref:Jacalin-type lectin domain-containing protein n=1 Tax=Ovis ammon polii TaxID=230172 RepID=A0AAD4Y2Y5_OVIAM|nr:hypothetical protein MG293_018020 [Ovis ammon polii]